MAKQPVRPFADQGNFTSIHNAVFDVIMPACAPNTFKVVLAVARATKGWQKDEDELSLSQIMERTGIKNRTTASEAIQDALGEKYIKRRPHPTKPQSFVYCLNNEYEIQTSTENVPATSTEIVPELVRKSDTQKERNKLKEQEGENALPLDPDLAKVNTAFMSLRGTMNAFQSSQLADILEDLRGHVANLPAGHPDKARQPADILCEAITVTGKNADRPNIGYLETVIKGWMQYGVGNRPGGKKSNGHAPRNGSSRPSAEERLAHRLEQIENGN